MNNRYLDCTVKMPRAYVFAEDAVKARVGPPCHVARWTCSSPSTPPLRTCPW